MGGAAAGGAAVAMGAACATRRSSFVDACYDFAAAATAARMARAKADELQPALEAAKRKEARRQRRKVERRARRKAAAETAEAAEVIEVAEAAEAAEVIEVLVTEAEARRPSEAFVELKSRVLEGEILYDAPAAPASAPARALRHRSSPCAGGSPAFASSPASSAYTVTTQAPSPATAAASQASVVTTLWRRLSLEPGAGWKSLVREELLVKAVEAAMEEVVEEVLGAVEEAVARSAQAVEEAVFIVAAALAEGRTMEGGEGGEAIVEGRAEAQITRAPAKRADAISTEMKSRADAMAISTSAYLQAGPVELTSQGELIITPDSAPDGLRSAAGGGAQRSEAASPTSEPRLLQPRPPTACSSGHLPPTTGSESGSGSGSGSGLGPPPLAPEGAGGRGITVDRPGPSTSSQDEWPVPEPPLVISPERPRLDAPEASALDRSRKEATVAAVDGECVATAAAAASEARAEGGVGGAAAEQSALEAKGMEAKGMEAKGMEAKGLDAMGMEAMSTREGMGAAVGRQQALVTCCRGATADTGQLAAAGGISQAGDEAGGISQAGDEAGGISQAHTRQLTTARSEAAGDQGVDTRRGRVVVQMPQARRPRSGGYRGTRGGTQREIAAAQREMGRDMQPEVTGGQWEVTPAYGDAGGEHRPRSSPARPRTTSHTQVPAAAQRLGEAAHLQPAQRGGNQRVGASNLEVVQWLEAQGGAIAAGSSGPGLLGLKTLCHRRSVRCAASYLTDSQPEVTQLPQPLGGVVTSGPPAAEPVLQTSTRLQMQRKMRRRARM